MAVTAEMIEKAYRRLEEQNIPPMSDGQLVQVARLLDSLPPPPPTGAPTPMGAAK